MKLIDPIMLKKTLDAMVAMINRHTKLITMIAARALTVKDYEELAKEIGEDKAFKELISPFIKEKNVNPMNETEKILDMALERLTQLDSDEPCDYLYDAGKECPETCAYSHPEKKCWKRYFERVIKDKEEVG